MRRPVRIRYFSGTLNSLTPPMSTATQSAIADPARCTGKHTRWLPCFLVLLLLLTGLQLLHLPQNLDYSTFAFGEAGANLNVAWLVRHGLRPAVDFGHPYGLFGLLLLDGWFRLTGLTPLAYFSFIVALEVLMVAALTDFAVTAELPWYRVAFIAVALPLFLWVNFLNAAHAVETACLVAAIVAHLKGHYDLALSATAAAVLSRPGLAYVYGVLLLVLVVVKIVRRELNPSILGLPVVTTLCLAIVLAMRFGGMSLDRTLLPTAGMQNYRLLNYGFFRKGMAFWWPSPFTFHHYLGGAGFWLLSAAAVILLGPIAFLRSRKLNRLRQREGEVALAAGIVAFVWVFFAFSHQYIGGWILYLFFSVLGVVLLGDFFRRFDVVLVVLLLMALNSDRHEIEASMQVWRASSASTLAAHMFSQGAEDEDIRQIFEFVRGHTTAVLQYSGEVTLMRVGLGQPVNEFFQPGISLPAEIAREKASVAKAEYVLIPTPRWYRGDTAAFSWPQFLGPQRQYHMVFRNPMGMVLAVEPAGDCPS